ncbi:MAG: acetyltransferase [Rhizobiaceae bacterium]|nr:acetyltransferase [Rhizobiaceae bacterium]
MASNEARKNARPRLVVLGGGGHAKVAIETLRDADAFDIAGFLDRSDVGEELIGANRLGDDTALAGLLGKGISHVFPAVGNNSVRVRLGEQARAAGFQIATAISPFAYISRSAQVGEGVLVVAGAVVNAETVIEDFVIINTNASVDHDGRIGAGAHIAPRCALAGCVSVGAQTLVGVGSSVLPQVTIGANSTIGAGSCVVRDIPANAKAFGVPARIVS